MRSSASAGSATAAAPPLGAVVALGGATLAPPHAATSAALAIRAPARKRRTFGRMERCICFPPLVMWGAGACVEERRPTTAMRSSRLWTDAGESGTQHGSVLCSTHAYDEKRCRREGRAGCTGEFLDSAGDDARAALRPRQHAPSGGPGDVLLRPPCVRAGPRS